MKPTPRTDALYHDIGGDDLCVDTDMEVVFDYARQLERELAEARRDTERLDFLLNGRLLFTYRDDIDNQMREEEERTKHNGN